MHNPFDQLAKKIGKRALDASGRTVVHREIARDAHYADIWHDPDPAREGARGRLGVLGQLASRLCLIEVFGHALEAAELRACIGKHFAHWEERERSSKVSNKRRREQQLPAEPRVDPFLWVLAAAVSEPLLRKLNVEPAPGFPRGVYLFGDDVFRIGIIVASELPRDRHTLLLRLMAAGPGLAQAIGELGGLPEDAEERIVADDVLIQLQSQLIRKPNRTADEEEIIMKVYGSMREVREEGRNEGREEGQKDGLVQSLLAVLRVRGFAVPDATRERILAEMDSGRLLRWLERAAVASSLTEVIGESS